MKNQYTKDIEFIKRIEKITSNKMEVRAYYVGFAACLMAHILYFVLFLSFGVKEMAYFNIFSVSFYAVTLLLVRPVKDKMNLVYGALAEIIVHASVATIYVGWAPDFGMFLLMIIPVAFLMPGRNKKMPFLITGVSVLLYGVLRYIYQYSEKTIYSLDKGNAGTVLYLINIVIGIFVLIYVTSIYTVINSYNEARIRVQNVQLKELASLDPLTRLNNRRSMNERLSGLSVESNISRTGYVIGLADIDDFKHVNDTYGHDYGDEVLNKMASVIAASVPEGCASRWGGEEFLFLLPGDTLAEASACAKKILSDVAACVFSKDGRNFSVTITVGLADGKINDDVEKIINTADKHLYIGKTSGKNRVVSG